MSCTGLRQRLQPGGGNNLERLSATAHLRHGEHRAGGKTCHVGDVEAQIDRTMEVVEGILASQSMSLADASRAIAYFKSAKDVAVFSKWLKRRGVKRLPLLNVCCDICRPDLLFELELDALQSHNP